MKKTIKINLSGVVFTIDEDAYEKLKNYLDAISRHFSNSTEAKEIMHDIEARIAELFQEMKPKDSEVISIELVQAVINIMGNPEDYVDLGDDATTGSSEQAGTAYSGYTGNKRLYRDPEHSVFGGVCAGLGAYFNIDPLIFKVLFLVFFFLGGSSLIVYIILWIVLPKAESAAQKLEMKGEPVNVSNIEKKVREEYDSAKEKVKEAVNSEPVKKTQRAAGNFFSELGKVLLIFVKVILMLIGTSFVLAGIGIIIGIVSGTFVGLHIFPFGNYDFSLGDLLTPFSDPVSITLLIISISLLVLIPVIAMIYGLIKLIFSIKTHNRGLTIGATSLWFVALLATFGIIAMETSNYSKSGSTYTMSELSIPSDTLIVAVNQLQKKEFEKNLAFDLDFDNEWYLTEDLDRIYGEIDLDIERSNDAYFHLEVERHSKGKNEDDAEENAANLNYNFSTRNEQLLVDPYFFVGKSDKWRFPRVDITVHVPEGKYVFLEKETRDILDDVYNQDHLSDWKMGGKLWMMSAGGLQLVKGD